MKAFVRKTGYVGGTVYFANTMEEAVDYFRDREVSHLEETLNRYRRDLQECSGPPSKLRGLQLMIDSYLRQIDDFGSSERDEWYRDSIVCYDVSKGVSIEVGDY